MDIGTWLRHLGLDAYEAAFRENGVSAEVLSHLTAEDLKELGVDAVGHRRQLLVAIAALRDDAPASRPVRPIDDRQAALSAAERRQITVLFCDIVGSVPLSAGLDPEELGELLSAYQMNVATAVTAERGYVARFVGDGVLTYFGWPNADEAHAESAVRAALAIIEAVASQKLAVRVGIATGLVVTGDLVGVGAAQTMTAVGDTPNLAARLQALAQPDTILVSEATRSQLGRMFELEELDTPRPKGSATPARAWRVLGRSDAVSRSEVVYRNAPIPLIGRQPELDLLLRQWEQTKAGTGRLVLLSGEAGIGKSRLLAAFEDRLGAEPRASLRYFCSPHHQDTPLYPLLARVEREAGFRRGDSAAERLAKLEAVFASTSPPPEDIALMAAFLSIPTEGRYPVLELSAQQRKMRTVSAAVRRLSALARRQPVLMLFEDAHWSDPSSIELLDAVIAHLPKLPVLLVISFRSDFGAPRVDRANAVTITLNRLDRTESASLAAQVATAGVLPETLLDRIVEQADGVPLFVEELTKAMQEARSTGEAPDARRQPVSAIPGSLHASLMARLDRLGSTKDVAQVGAVIGRTFDYELLAAVSGWAEAELESALRRLVDSGLVFARGAPPYQSYMFKHALVQDTAYDSLLRGSRRALHGKVAEALEHRSGLEQVRPEILAHHWSGAGEPQRAVQCWLNGARQTLVRLAPAEALQQTGHGLAELDALPEDEWRWQTEVELQLVAANAMMVTHGHAAPPTGAALVRAAELCDRLPSTRQRLDAQLGLWSHLMLRGELHRAVEMAEAMLAADNRGDDSRWRLAGLRTRGIVRFLLGQFDESVDDLQRFVALWDGGQPSEGLGLVHDPGSISVHCYRSYGLTFAGRIDEARHHVEAAMKGALASGHHLIVAQAMFTEAVLECSIGANELAKAMLERTLDYAVEHGVVYFKMFAATYLSTLEGLDGDVERALRRIGDEIEFVRASGTYAYMPGFLAREGELLTLAGRVPEALTRFAEAFALMEQTAAHWDEATIRRRFATTLAVDGRETEAAGQLRRALAVARSQRARVYELEAACDMAPMLARKGRASEARDLLRSGLDYFAQEKMIPIMVRARDILLQLAPGGAAH